MKEYKTIASEIIIIDLLTACDEWTATSLKDDLENMISNKGIKGWCIKYEKCHSELSLMQLLQKIESGYKGNIPIIHIEAHGCEMGFDILDNDFVEWIKLFDKLEKINKLTCNNLLLTVAACKGAHSLRSAVSAKYCQTTSPMLTIGECPVYAMLGPDKDIWDCHIRDGFKAFFEKLIYCRDLEDSVRAQEQAMVGVPISCFQSDVEIEEVLKREVPKLCSESNLRRLIRTACSNDNLTDDICQQIRDKVRIGVTKSYNEFLMVDCCSENKHRFDFCVDNLVNDSWDNS